MKCQAPIPPFCLGCEVGSADKCVYIYTQLCAFMGISKNEKWCTDANIKGVQLKSFFMLPKC